VTERLIAGAVLAAHDHHRLDCHEARPVEAHMADGIWGSGFLEACRKVEGDVGHLQAPVDRR
jgi:hypothetical protein